MKKTVVIFMIAILLSLWVASIGFNETLIGNVEATTDISDNLVNLSDEAIDTIVFLFGDNNEKLLFTWEDGKFHAEYPEGKLDETGKKFVEWLEQYMNEDYCKNKKD